MRKTFVLLLILVSFSPVFAKDYYFKQMNIHATVLENSDIVVQENYTYSFEGVFTYVYRSFYLSEIEGIYDFRVWNADTGEVYTASVSGDFDEVNYRWDIDARDEDQTYIMEYRMVGAIKEYDENIDYLWYSIVPVEREKGIESVNFWITFPQSVELDIVSRVSGTHSKTKAGDETILITASNIPSYTALDAEFHLPEGMVEFYITPNQMASIVLSAIMVLGFAAGFMIFLYIALRDYMKHGRDPVVKEFKTLRRLRPALAGITIDEKADIKEIESTILDLAIRGYIYIREEEKGTFLKRKEIWFIKTKEPRNLMEYEILIMNGIFGSKDKIKVSSLKNKFYKKVPKILESMHEEAEKQGLFDKSVKETISSYMVKFIIVPILMIAFLIGSFMLFLMLGFSPVGYLFPVFILTLVSTFFIFIIAGGFAFAMPRKTEEGVIHYHRYKELRDWMEEYPLKEGRLFDEYLPYATAFGIQKVWVRKLRDIEGYKSDWYSGPYTSAGFVAIHSSLISASAAPGSAGGAGGGFGGGGGAGGGGAGAG